MMVQNRFVDVSIFDPIKVHSPHQKAISHAILHGIVKEFTGGFSGVYPRCKHVLRSGIIAVHIQCTYHPFQPGASFEGWFLPQFLVDWWAASYCSFTPCIVGANESIWPISKLITHFDHIICTVFPATLFPPISSKCHNRTHVKSWKSCGLLLVSQIVSVKALTSCLHCKHNQTRNQPGRSVTKCTAPGSGIYHFIERWAPWFIKW